MPEFLYHKDPYAKDAVTTIGCVFEEEGKNMVSIADCLFYPQGGGQKGDRGTLTADGLIISVTDTIKDRLSDTGGSLLVVDRFYPGLKAGETVVAALDWLHRYSQMRLHSAVHLHHCVMEDLLGRRLPYPVTSELLNDGSAYNRYDTTDVTETLTMRAAEELRALVATGAPVTARDDLENPGSRWWACLTYSIPCGGTHIRDIQEIGSLDIAFSQRKGRPKISLRLM